FVDLFLLNERVKRQAIHQSEERFRLLVESMQDYAIIMLDPQGLVTSWNEGAEKIKGFKQEEVIGKSFYRFYSAEDRANGLPLKALEQATKENRYEEEGWRVRKDGSRYWANVILTALRDENENLIGFSKIS